MTVDNPPALHAPSNSRSLPPITAADDLMRSIRHRLADRQSQRPAGPRTPWQWGKFFRFGSGSETDDILISGWSYPESDYVWSDGDTAVLRLPEPPSRGELLLHFKVEPFQSHQTVRISHASHLVALWTVKAAGEFGVLLPSRTQDGPIELRWDFPNAASPRELGLSPDRRKLAVALHTLTAYTPRLGGRTV